MTTVEHPNMGRYVDLLRARKEVTDNPKHIAMLDLLIEHTIAEVWDHDIERTMATLVDDCLYHHSGDRKLVEALGFARELRGNDEVRKHYTSGMAAGIFHPEKVAVDVDHLFVTDDGIAFDGNSRWLVPGTLAVAAGATLPENGTADDNYVMSVRSIIVVPFQRAGANWHCGESAGSSGHRGLRPTDCMSGSDFKRDSRRSTASHQRLTPRPVALLALARMGVTILPPIPGFVGRMTLSTIWSPGDGPVGAVELAVQPCIEGGKRARSLSRPRSRRRARRLADERAPVDASPAERISAS